MTDAVKTRDVIISALGFIFIISLAYFLSSITIPIAISFLIAYIAAPWIDFLENKKIPRTISILFLFIIAILLILLLMVYLIPLLIEEIQQFQSKIPYYLEKCKTLVCFILSRFRSFQKSELLMTQYENTVGKITTYIPLILKYLSKSLWSVSGSVLGTISLIMGFMILPVYIFYFLRDIDKIQRNWPKLIPIGAREEMTSLVQEISNVLGAFFRGQLLVALVVGSLNSIGFWFVKIDFAILLGLAIGFLNIIPYFGIIVGSIPAILLAYFKFHDWQHILAVVMVLLIVQVLEGIFISPKIMGEKVGLHPLVVFISIMVWGSLLGFLGLLLAIPLTCILFIIYRRYALRR